MMGQALTKPRAGLLTLAALLLLGGCGAPADRLTQGEGTPARGLRIAGAAMAGGMPQAALNATQSVLSRDPNNVDALLQQAEALTAMGRDDAAGEAYHRVLAREASPSREQVRLARAGAGRADLAAGRGAQAEAVYAAMVADAPSSAPAHDGLAIALDLQGKHAAAQAEYRKALALSDTSATRSNLGLSLAMAGDGAGALEVLRPLAADPAATPKTRHNLAFALELTGDRNGARQALSVDMPQSEIPMALAGFDAFRTASVSAPSSASTPASVSAAVPIQLLPTVAEQDPTPQPSSASRPVRPAATSSVAPSRAARSRAAEPVAAAAPTGATVQDASPGLLSATPTSLPVVPRSGTPAATPNAPTGPAGADAP